MFRTATAAFSVTALALLMLAGCSSMGSADLRHNGVFSPCGGPHCVSSQDTDPARHVDAITYAGTREGAQELMVSLITVMPGAKLVEQQDGYLHATFTSENLGFVDDLELQFPSQKFIDVRSSSRMGVYDFGVNRQRIADLRKAFNDRQP